MREKNEDAVRFLYEGFDCSVEQRVYVYAASFAGRKEGRKEMKLL